MGEIASIIAAVAFAVLVVFLALPLWKLAKLFDQMRISVRNVATSADQTVAELNATVRDAHAQLGHVDTVTASTARVAQDVSALSTLVTSSLARPLIGMIALRRTIGDYFKRDKEPIGRHAQTGVDSADMAATSRAVK